MVVQVQVVVVVVDGKGESNFPLFISREDLLTTITPVTLLLMMSIRCGGCCLLFISIERSTDRPMWVPTTHPRRLHYTRTGLSRPVFVPCTHVFCCSNSFHPSLYPSLVCVSRTYYCIIYSRRYSKFRILLGTRVLLLLGAGPPFLLVGLTNQEIASSFLSFHGSLLDEVKDDGSRTCCFPSTSGVLILVG
jgi:hypothetical protein